MPRKKTPKTQTESSSLSSENMPSVPPKLTPIQVEDINQKVFAAINEVELQRSMDRWLKNNKTHQQTNVRDMGIIRSIITEYLDSYILFGYSLEGDRVVLQNFKGAKERDALMEFFKILFFKQQHGNIFDDGNG